MQFKNLLPALGLLALTATPSTEAVSGVLLGYVELDNVGREVPAGGGGVSKFLIGDYAASEQAYRDGNFSASGVLGSAGGFVFASCIEYYETWDTSNRWYALYAGLDGAPSATADITSGEAAVIERVLTGEFGPDFSSTGPESRTDKVRGLQALLWEAGKSGNPADDFADGQVDPKGTGGKSLAETWLAEYATAGLDEIVTYALITVDWDENRGQGGFVDAGKQDFFTYAPDVDETPGVPTPVPVLLIGLGLLVLRGVSRGHA